jgi:3-dehydroquinate synthase
MSTSVVHVSLGERSYDVHVGEGVLDRAGELISGASKGRVAAVVTNPRIGRLYTERVVESLQVAGITGHVIMIPAGERYKTLNTVRRVYEKMLDHRIDRTGMVIGLGGGVVGDLAGFVAATYLRGIDFVQMPTSLLAQVDASVGGKVGVDLPRGKNLVGAFYQPRIVLADTGTLRTLAKSQYRSGLAEVIKHGLILDSEYYAYLERNLPAIMRLEAEPLWHLVERSVELKAWVVTQDERESGLRAILNYGHTVGHAIESLTGYKRLLHGEAVAIGMVTAAFISQEMGFLDDSITWQIVELLQRTGLPYRPPDGLSPEAVVEAMKLDKKVAHGKLRFVLVNEIGSAFVSEDVTPEIIAKALKAQGRL